MDLKQLQAELAREKLWHQQAEARIAQLEQDLKQCELERETALQNCTQLEGAMKRMSEKVKDPLDSYYFFKGVSRSSSTGQRGKPTVTVKRTPSKVINDTKQREIYEGCHRGDTAQVRALLQGKHVDVNCRFDVGRHAYAGGFSLFESGATCLMIAAMKGKTDTAAMLITEFHAKITDQDDSGRTPLHYACRYGHLDVVRLLHEEFKADIEARNCRGATPLMKAAFYGNFDVVEYLIQRGAEVNKMDNDGKTALALAGGTKETKARIIEFLVQNGAK